jgi:hypothetical protein
MMVLALVVIGCLPATPTPPGDPPRCGPTLACRGDEVCVQQTYEPSCDERLDTGADCPEGTTPSRCGGVGYPCCCGDAPEPTWSCVAPIDCDGEVTCACLPDACSEGACEPTLDPDAFVCAPLAKP